MSKNITTKDRTEQANEAALAIRYAAEADQAAAEYAEWAKQAAADFGLAR